MLFVGAASGGLWKSEDGGSSWFSLSGDLPLLGVTDLYIDPKNENKMYVLTGDAYGGDTSSNGVFVSTDGGNSWVNDSNFAPETGDLTRVYKMIVHPENSDVLLIAGTNGIWKSIDGAQSWSRVKNGNFTDIAFKPGDPNTVYCSTQQSSDFEKSIDAGDTWTTINTPIEDLRRTAIGVSPANPEYVYVLAADLDATFGGVFKSTDSGETFTLQSDSPNIFGYSPTASDDSGQGWYDLAIAVNPDDAEDIYVSGIHVWNSKDGGQTWQDEDGTYQILNFWVYDPFNTDNYVHADNHTLDFLGGELFAGCDGGIFKTANLGQSWVDLSEGLIITQLYRLGLDQNDPGIIVAGAQDNGSNILKDETWTHIFGADGMEALVDHTDPSTIYSSYQVGGILKYDNTGGGNARVISGSLMGAWVTPFMLDPADNNFLYAGYDNVWRYDNAGEIWEEISNFETTGVLSCLNIAPTNSDYIYVASASSVYKTTNGGTSWINISEGLPLESITYIGISEENPKKIWVTFSGYDEDSKVYESIDGGESWRNISQGLPNIPINCIVHQRNTNDQLYVGTDIGVYQRDNSGQWQAWFDGLPNVIVSELEIHYGSKKIVAATYGRGLWSADLITSNTGVEAISASQIEVVEGNSISFDATLNGESSSYAWTFEGGSPATSSEAAPVVFYNEEGFYDVELNGERRSEMINVLDYVAIESIETDVDVVDVGKRVTFTSSYEGNPSSWYWRFEGGVPSNSSAETPLISYRSEGSYDVTLSISGDTSDEKVFEDFVTVIDVLSIGETGVEVYPSISSGVLFLKIEERNTSIELMTQTGQTIRKLSADEDITMNIEDIAAGIYVLKIATKKEVKTVRIIKQ